MQVRMPDQCKSATWCSMVRLMGPASLVGGHWAMRRCRSAPATNSPRLGTQPPGSRNVDNIKAEFIACKPAPGTRNSGCPEGLQLDPTPIPHAIPCHPMPSHAIPCNPMPSHAIPCRCLSESCSKMREDFTYPNGKYVHSRASLLLRFKPAHSLEVSRHRQTGWL